MSLSIPYPILGTGVADSTKIDSNFNVVASKFGNIDNSDVKSGAGIDINKLSASYEYINVNFQISAGDITAFAGGSRALQAIPLYNDGKGDWSVIAANWVCTDCGAGTAQFRLKWAYYNAGVLSGIVNITPATTISNATAINQGTVTISAPSLAFDANSRSIFLTDEAADATVLDTADTFLNVSMHLKRQIAT